MTSFRGVVAAFALLCVVAAACGTGGPSSDVGPPEIRLAVLQHGDLSDQIEIGSSSSLGAGLAIDQAIATGELSPESDLSFIETGGVVPADAVAVAREVAADPTVVAAIVAPLTDAPDAERVFIDAGVPVFSLSGFGGVPESPLWRRLVPTAAEEAEALDEAAGPNPCSAGSPPVLPPLDARPLPGGSGTAIAGAVAQRACSGLVWLGDADGALATARAFHRDGAEATLALWTPARVDRFAGEGYPAAVGTVAVVPCPTVDVSTEPEARRFVHAYQARHGAAPGMCAAEGYGLGAWLIASASRVEAASGLAATDRIRAPGGWLDLTGEPVEPTVETVVGVRWLPGA